VGFLSQAVGLLSQAVGQIWETWFFKNYAGFFTIPEVSGASSATKKGVKGVNSPYYH
jgi:hypothetical protein